MTRPFWLEPPKTVKIPVATGIPYALLTVQGQDRYVSQTDTKNGTHFDRRSRPDGIIGPEPVLNGLPIESSNSTGNDR